MANTRTVGSTGKDHTTIASALSWMQANHDFGTDGIATVSIEENAEFNESALQCYGITGTPTASAYLKVTASASFRHNGTLGSGARVRGNTNGNHVFIINQSYVHIEYLEIQQDSTGGSDEGIRVNNGSSGNNSLISHCIIWTDQNVVDQDGVYTGNVSNTVSVDNCIIFGFHRAGLHAQQYSGTKNQTWNVDSCTISKCGGEATSDSGGVSARSAGGTTTMNIYNTGSVGNDDNDYNEVAGGGTVSWNGSHNADSDGTLTGKITTSAQQNLTVTASSQSSGSWFVVNNITAGSEDYTLLDDAAGNLAYGNATDRVGSEPDARQDFSLDIAGNTRSTTSPSPDIGASEFIGGAPAPASFIHAQESKRKRALLVR